MPGLARATVSPPTRRRRGAEAGYTCALIAAVGALFAVGVVMPRVAPHGGFSSVQLAPIETDDELRTATIQLAPNRHDRCARMSFDNRSGDIRYRGERPCEDIALGPEHVPGRRLALIREGFRWR